MWQINFVSLHVPDTSDVYLYITHIPKDVCVCSTRYSLRHSRTHSGLFSICFYNDVFLLFSHTFYNNHVPKEWMHSPSTPKPKSITIRRGCSVPNMQEGEFQIEKQIRCVDQLAHSSINRVLLISIFWHLLNFFCEKDILIRMAHWFQIHHSGIIMFCTLTVSVRSWRSALSSVRPASLVRPGKSALSSSQFVKDTFAYDMNRHSVIEKTEVKILKLEK